MLIHEFPLLLGRKLTKHWSLFSLVLMVLWIFNDMAKPTPNKNHIQQADGVKVSVLPQSKIYANCLQNDLSTSLTFNIHVHRRQFYSQSNSHIHNVSSRFSILKYSSQILLLQYWSVSSLN